ncbi:PadR family transcriptional regulator [Bacillus lacus]|uniref:PadR family transcriptional regulator n=1 Tax=Metabacillus lacus TaxID=1983721 RepID=A0A7X2LYI3_9BACI|nr:PadR family transcriptional regulator [Metabacillus lacus]MRX71873.1 PadR family transcriptional regulator [Metabacillus lacus]
MSLRYGLLSMIAKDPQTGYQMFQNFQEQFLYFWNSNSSQVYKELVKMEGDQLISFEYIYEKGKPVKKLYHITPKGEKELIDWVIEFESKAAKIKDEFLLRAYAFHMISTGEAIALLYKMKAREEGVLYETSRWNEERFKQIPEKIKLGEFVTAEFGIRYSNMYIDWCKWAIELLESYQES